MEQKDRAPGAALTAGETKWVEDKADEIRSEDWLREQGLMSEAGVLVDSATPQRMLAIGVWVGAELMAELRPYDIRKAWRLNFNRLATRLRELETRQKFSNPRYRRANPGVLLQILQELCEQHLKYGSDPRMNGIPEVAYRKCAAALDTFHREVLRLQKEETKGS